MNRKIASTWICWQHWGQQTGCWTFIRILSWRHEIRTTFNFMNCGRKRWAPCLGYPTGNQRRDASSIQMNPTFRECWGCYLPARKQRNSVGRAGDEGSLPDRTITFQRGLSKDKITISFTNGETKLTCVLEVRNYRCYLVRIKFHGKRKLISRNRATLSRWQAVSFARVCWMIQSTCSNIQLR